MNHKSVSIIKSIIRIIACLALILSEFSIATYYMGDTEISGLVVFAGLFGIAEILGIIEEIVDKRKE